MDIPASMPSDGTLKVVFVEAVADPTGVPTIAELQGGTDLSCYLTADGWNPSTEEAVVTDSRLCSKQDFEQPGRVTETLDIRYVFNTLIAEDVARQTLARGSAGFLYLRWGLDVDDEWTITDEVDRYPIKTGVQKKMPPEANSVHRIDQKAFITGEVLRDLTVLAA